MTNEQRTLRRAAAEIHQSLTRDPAEARRINLPIDYWNRCEALARRVAKARRHGLPLAAARLERQCLEAIQSLHQETANLQRQLDATRRKPPLVSLHDIYSDLVALDGEFDELRIDLSTGTVSVATEPIILEGVYLGPFEIQLDWSELGKPHVPIYRVVAREPNPAALDDSVTHPHVQDEALCEGEGRTSIRHAQEQGRLFDFFVIVANLLRNYNPSSPFVSLSNWDGVECSDCGASLPDDEQWTCEQCHSTLCGECMVHCSGCDSTFCARCLSACENCERDCCQNCLRRCTVCHAWTCRDCFLHTNVCENCHADSTEDSNPRESTGAHGACPARGSATAIQSDGLGEASVSA